MLQLAPLLLAAHLAAAPAASVLLPPDHWAVLAVDRLEQLGLVDRYLPAEKAVPVMQVAMALAEAASRARRRRPELVAETQAYLDRLAVEWRLGGGDLGLLEAHSALGYRWSEVRQPALQSALPSALHLAEPDSSGLVDLGAAIAVGDHLAFGGELQATKGHVDFPGFEAVGALGKWSLSVGRARAGYGFMESGGITLSGAATLDRIELMTIEPLQLGGALAALGLFTFDTFLARFDEARHPYSPLLWGAALQWRPHPRLTFGLYRAVMVGGGPWAGTSFSSKVGDLLLLSNSGVANNVASAGARWRLPTDALLPLTLRVEWGTDDNGGSYVQEPGILAGLTAPRVPGLPLSLGVEYGYIGRVYRRPDFAWYSHGNYYGGWATGETPLGDPLGGNGNVLRAVATVFEPMTHIHGTVTAWSERRFERNLYGPYDGGRDPGVRGEVVLPLPGRFELSGSGEWRRVGTGRAAAFSIALTGFL